MGPTTTSDETSAVGSSLVAKTPKSASVVVEKQPPVENAITQQGPPAPQQTNQQGPPPPAQQPPPSAFLQSLRDPPAAAAATTEAITTPATTTLVVAAAAAATAATTNNVAPTTTQASPQTSSDVPLQTTTAVPAWPYTQATRGHAQPRGHPVQHPQQRPPIYRQPPGYPYAHAHHMMPYGAMHGAMGAASWHQLAHASSRGRSSSSSSRGGGGGGRGGVAAAAWRGQQPRPPYPYPPPYAYPPPPFPHPAYAAAAARAARAARAAVLPKRRKPQVPPPPPLVQQPDGTFIRYVAAHYEVVKEDDDQQQQQRIVYVKKKRKQPQIVIIEEDEEQPPPPVKKPRGRPSGRPKQEQTTTGATTTTATTEPPPREDEKQKRERMNDRVLLSLFHEFYHLKEQTSVRGFTFSKAIGRSYFSRYWKEVGIGTFKEKDQKWDKDVMKYVSTFFAKRQNRVVDNGGGTTTTSSTGGCKSFLTPEEEQIFLDKITPSAQENSSGEIDKEMCLPIIKEIVKDDTPASLVNFVCKAVVESLFMRKRHTTGIKTLSDLTAKIQAKLREKQQRDAKQTQGKLAGRKRDIKILKDFLLRIHGYIEKKPTTYWQIIQTETDDKKWQPYDTSKDEMTLMARLFFDEEDLKEIKVGKPWVDLLRLRILTKVTEHRMTLSKDFFDAKVQELEQSLAAKQDEVKELEIQVVAKESAATSLAALGGGGGGGDQEGSVQEDDVQDDQENEETAGLI